MIRGTSASAVAGMPEPPPTNMRIIEPSRKAVRAGDVFTYLMPDGLHRFGRVISTEARIGPMERVELLYFYEAVADTEDPPLDELRPDRLLIPPQMTNRLGWRRGYYKTVRSGPVEAGMSLAQHCFVDSRGRYHDEMSNDLPGPVEPVGDWGLASFRTIDDDISRALGLPLAPD